MTQVAIRTDRVIELCEYRIQRAQEVYERDREELIAACILPRWRRILGLGPRTRAQAIKALQRHNDAAIVGPLDKLMWRMTWSIDAAERLLSCARVSSMSLMLVSSEDAQRLQAWAEGKASRENATTQATTFGA